MLESRASLVCLKGLKHFVVPVQSITKTTSHLKLRWGQKPGNQQLPSRPEAPNFEPGPPTSP